MNIKLSFHSDPNNIVFLTEEHVKELLIQRARLIFIFKEGVSLPDVFVKNVFLVTSGSMCTIKLNVVLTLSIS